jgi:uncharacterized protein (UPF0335 family)
MKKKQEEIKMKNERRVFKMYADRTHSELELRFPFTHPGYVYASDACILIRVRESAVKGAYLRSQKPDCSYLFTETEKEETLTTGQLEKLIGETERAEEERTGLMGEFFSVKLAGKSFSVHYIRMIIKTMKLLGIREITMRYNENEPNRQAIFNFSPEVDVLLMPRLGYGNK